MPQVPFPQDSSVKVDVVRQPRLSGEAFGANKWNQIGQLANEGVRVGAVLNDKQDEMDKAAAKQAYTNFSTIINGDWNERVKPIQGEASKEIPTVAQDVYQKRFSEVSKGMSPRVANYFNILTSDLLGAWQRQTSDFKTVRDEEFKKAADAGFVDRLSNEVAGAPGDVVENKLIELGGEVYKQNSAMGEDFAGKKRREAIDAALSNRVTAIGSTNPVAALDELAKFESKMSPEAYSTQRERLLVEAGKLSAKDLAIMVGTGQTTEEDAIKQAEKDAEKYNPEGYDHLQALFEEIGVAKKQVEAGAMRQEAAEKSGAFGGFFQAVSTGDINAITAYEAPTGSSPSTAMAVSRLKNAYLTEQIKGEPTATSQRLEVQLSMMSGEDFKKQDPNTWIGVLSTDAFNRNLERWRKSRNGDDQERVSDGKVNDAIRSALVAAGKKKPTTDEIAAVRFLTQSHIDAANAEGKPVDQQYVFNVAAAYAIDKVYEEKNFKKAFTKGDEYELRASAFDELSRIGVEANDGNVKKLEKAYKSGKISAEIPETARQSIAEALRRQGVTPTENRIRAAWIKSAVKF